MTNILGTTNTMEAQCKTKAKIYAKKRFLDIIFFYSGVRPYTLHNTRQTMPGVLLKLLTDEPIFIPSNTKWPLEGLH